MSMSRTYEHADGDDVAKKEVVVELKTERVYSSILLYPEYESDRGGKIPVKYWTGDISWHWRQKFTLSSIGSDS
jgi:hypothetical protein